MFNVIQGDLFSHKPYNSGSISIFVHSCNTQGSWGAGVATAFRTQFPSTYGVHQDYCSQYSSTELLGTSQIIASNPRDPGHNTIGPTFVVCLFTSDFTTKPEDIIEYTDMAMRDFSIKLQIMEDNLDRKGDRIMINMPKINSGIFGVPWNKTEKVLAEYSQYEYNVYVI